MATQTTYERSGVGEVFRSIWTGVEQRERALWGVVCVAAMADILLTYYGLERGLIERNPIAREAILSAGYAAMPAMKVAAIGVGLACRPLLPDRHTALVPLALATPWAIAAVINLWLISLA